MDPESPHVKSLIASGWQLDDSKMGISKTFYFKTFTKCQDFFNLIAIRSKSAKHHSTTTIRFRSVHVHWTTHNPASLSSLDVMMAKFCEDQAKLVGDVNVDQITTC
ncbi:Transcriptional coactivator/pterin dehydratase [Ascosphaera apis ARSEF 7405]|uniref:4a-hydroxytetrahydrobiopterin dehydratase n=1 Tax=Ascosphaera apis ARSEF 7405 TaxID=392613 RepID=A0A162IB66_9EURO|nr:Transcriptional coactivator/pterin dehydratase [Ascosphaera apis ARSEF 7405]